MIARTAVGAVNSAADGDNIVVSGTCNEENVTITTDGITIRGDPGVGGTLNGGFIVDGAQRVVIDNLLIDGGCAEPCEFDPDARVDGVRPGGREAGWSVGNPG